MTEDIQRKIAALLRKSQGTDNVAEAELFAAKAQEMLDKHNLTMDDLSETGDVLKDTIDLK